MYNSNYHTTKDLIRVKRDRITYNTYMDPIELRGYGRNIQNMVEHCLTIEDRAERTKAALSTLVSMHKIRPDIDKLTTLCDHLYFISGYELDIDYPNGYKPVKLEKLTSGPSRIIYPGKQFAFRHYGFNLDLLLLPLHSHILLYLLPLLRLNFLHQLLPLHHLDLPLHYFVLLTG